MLVRLDKHLVEASVGTRSQVKELIKKGRISVNGNNKLKPELKIDNEKDKIFFDG
ncbi:MAG: 16S rRNA pseudouridine(516) synthase, partial [Lachnospira sp.]|nr:16S rRNA pseudouridine(516) synthase [Lachnospira sp.]